MVICRSDSMNGSPQKSSLLEDSTGIATGTWKSFSEFFRMIKDYPQVLSISSEIRDHLKSFVAKDPSCLNDSEVLKKYQQCLKIDNIKNTPTSSPIKPKNSNPSTSYTNSNYIQPPNYNSSQDSVYE